MLDYSSMLGVDASRMKHFLVILFLFLNIGSTQLDKKVPTLCVLNTLKTKSWSRLVTIGQMGLKNESQLVERLVT